MYQELYERTGLPKTLPRVREIFDRTMHAGKNAFDPPYSTELAQDVIMSQAGVTRLILEAGGMYGEPPEAKRYNAAISPLVGSYMDYAKGGTLRAVFEFGIAPVWNAWKARKWEGMLQSPRADMYVSLFNPSQMTRETMAAHIVESIKGYKELHEQYPDLLINSETRERLQQCARALDALNVDSLPETMRHLAVNTRQEASLILSARP